ncbi:hypothetical protein Q8A64_00145 [Oxalobacteraceae bacterium R-40]|uniref:Peptidase M41 domain-containing protein n=1 Tax=Keguizhuia sedimenti TaxID=3064264 RepID=A0ABU1BII8_9BURK|nr:hypothetical protein [Oxalobacteraceae bacterium R-40]
MNINDYSYRQIVAYHEAGHAVVAWSHSVRIYSMGYGPKNAYVRDALGWPLFEDMRLENVPKHAQILLGGEIAEKALYELCSEFYDPIQSMGLGPNGDLEKLQELAEYFFEKNAVDWIREMREETDKIVLKNWARVEALAAALDHKGTLTGIEIGLVIDGTGPI